MKSLFAILIVLCATCFGSLPSLAQEAAFGLSWGMSTNEFEKEGILLEELRNEASYSQFKTTKLPKTPSRTDFFSLIISKKFGLQKIMWYSATITEDAYGIEGKELYGKIKSVMIKKYGDPDSFEYTGKHLYQEPDEFYQCLAYDGCGHWISFWSSEGLSMKIGIEGLGRGSGYIEVGYEGPKFATMLQEVEKNEEAKQEDSF